jgi:uncharacterized protein (DUF1015 family)
MQLKPFKATILNPELENRAGLLCPVYDTIDAPRYDRYSTNRNNVIHITTRRENVTKRDFVDHAKQNLNRFFNDGILVETEKSSFYIYGVRYRLSEAVMEQIPEKARRDTYFAFGLVALVKVEKLNEHSVLGHEKTFEANTRERYHLMKECGMNFSPIVAEYNMPGHDINSIFEDYLGFHRPDLKINAHKKPIIDVVLNGARHLLWELSDEAMIGKIQQLLSDKKVMILDGHHRYTASYRLSRDQVEDYTLMMLLEGGDRALVLLPWHRCVKKCHSEDLWTRIKANFAIEYYDRSNCKDAMVAINSKLGVHDDDVRLGMYDGEKFYLLHADKDKIRKLAEERDERIGLDVISLHEWLINPTLIGRPEDILFTASPQDAIENVDKGAYQIAFFLKPLRIADVEYKVEVEKRVFPQKSTLFLPKVAEGVVMRRFGEAVK